MAGGERAVEGVAGSTSSRLELSARYDPGDPLIDVRSETTKQDKIYQFLLQRIIDGGIKPGMAIPTEAELQRLFGVSRSPARLAVERLRSEGLVERHRGRGTFVSFDRPRGAWTRVSGFLPYFQQYWDRITLEVLEVSDGAPPDSVLHFFRAAPFDGFLSVKRRRSMDGKPFMLIENWIPAVVMADELASVDQTNLFYEFLERHGVFLKSAYEVVEPVAADGEVARLLMVEEGTPTLHIERRVFDKVSRPFMFSTTHVPAGAWKYQTTLSV